MSGNLQKGDPVLNLSLRKTSPHSGGRLLSLLLALTLWHDTAFATSLGRLFYTPQERRAMEAAQRGEGQGAVPGGARVTLDGIISRSSGKNTAWINGIPQTEGLQLSQKKGVPEGARIRLPDNKKEVSLKVGQSLDTVSGQVRESYQGGGNLP